MLMLEEKEIRFYGINSALTLSALRNRGSELFTMPFTELKNLAHSISLTTEDVTECLAILHSFQAISIMNQDNGDVQIALNTLAEVPDIASTPEIPAPHTHANSTAWSPSPTILSELRQHGVQSKAIPEWKSAYLKCQRRPEDSDFKNFVLRQLAIEQQSSTLDNWKIAGWLETELASKGAQKHQLEDLRKQFITKRKEQHRYSSNVDREFERFVLSKLSA